MARESTLPFNVESYPAVPPKPITSRFDNSYSPAPLAVNTTSLVVTLTKFRVTFE